MVCEKCVKILTNETKFCDTDQSNGSFFMRRLSRGKYPGGYRRLWYWSQRRRLFRGGVGIIFALIGSLTVDNLGSVSPSWENIRKTKYQYLQYPQTLTYITDL